MRPVYRRLGASHNLTLLVTGSLYREEFRSALEEVRADGFGDLLWADPGPKLENLTSLSAFVLEYTGQRLRERGFDLALIQGDRLEALGFAIACAVANLGVVHMSGGDRSGSIDECARNAITQLAHLHLTTCESSSDRVKALGESPSRILQVGEPALDAIADMVFLSLKELNARLATRLNQGFVIVTHHPETTRPLNSAEEFRAILKTLEKEQIQALITHPNGDDGSDLLHLVLDDFREHELFQIVPHLGQQAFLSAMKLARAMIGNSSAGILEAPSFGLPVLNIGGRQHGRMRAGNVLDCGSAEVDIQDGIRRLLSDKDFLNSARVAQNPYGDGRTASRVVDVVSGLPLGPRLIEKWKFPELNLEL